MPNVARFPARIELSGVSATAAEADRTIEIDCSEMQSIGIIMQSPVEARDARAHALLV